MKIPKFKSSSIIVNIFGMILVVLAVVALITIVPGGLVLLGCMYGSRIYDRFTMSDIVDTEVDDAS